MAACGTSISRPPLHAPCRAGFEWGIPGDILYAPAGTKMIHMQSTSKTPLQGFRHCIHALRRFFGWSERRVSECAVPCDVHKKGACGCEFADSGRTIIGAHVWVFLPLPHGGYKVLAAIVPACTSINTSRHNAGVMQLKEGTPIMRINAHGFEHLFLPDSSFVVDEGLVFGGRAGM